MWHGKQVYSETFIDRGKVDSKKATEIALAMETVEKNTGMLQNADSPRAPHVNGGIQYINSIRVKEGGSQEKYCQGLAKDADKNRTMLPSAHTKNQSATLVVKWDT